MIARYAFDFTFGNRHATPYLTQPRDFADTRLGVIVNRLKKGEIGADSQRAAAALGEPEARFVLQGRDEHTGIMIPDEMSIKYGQHERKLLA